MSSGGAVALAYLASEYPAVSHTFILREIQQLRQSGIAIRTASIRPPLPGAGGFTEAESHEAAGTFYVKTRNPLRIVLDHAGCLLRRPFAYLAGLLLAFRLGGLDLKAVLYHLLYFIEAVVVGEWMRRNSLTHLHVHFANAAATSALLLKRVYGIPYSITVHGSDEFYATDLYRLREKIAGASFLRCVSKFCRSQLMKAGSPDDWGKMEVCPLGVDPDLFRPRRAPAGGALHVMCVSRLVPAKGHTVLLAAMAILVKRGRRVHVDLVGDGPYRQAFESEAARLMVAAHTTFHGSVNQHRVLELLESADIFVLPSFAEGVPVCLMEAMAMEIPCVSTIIAGIPELIQSGKEGLLVPASDPESLASAVEMLMDDPELRFSLGREGRRKIVESYNLRTNVERLVSIFERRLHFRMRAAEECTLDRA